MTVIGGISTGLINGLLSGVMGGGFLPSSIKDEYGNSLLMQQLYGRVAEGFTIPDVKSTNGTDRLPQVGRAYMTTSVSEYVTVDYAKPAGMTNATICGWFKDNGSVSGTRMFSFTGGNRGIDVRVSGDKVDVIIGSAGGVYSVYRTDADVGLSEWHHIAVTISDYTFIIYIDGVAASGSVIGTSGGGYTGSMAAIEEINLSSGVNGGFRSAGFFHDFRVFEDVAKTPEQIQAIYNKQPDLDGLVLQWKCEDKGATVAWDSSGNENHGTKASITVETFHYEGADVPYSYSDNVGFTDGVNLFTNSENFTSSTWGGGGGGGATFQTGIELSPDGVTYADTLTGSNDNVQTKQDVAVENGGIHTLSMYLKCSAGETRTVAIMINNVKQTPVTVTDQWTRFEAQADVQSLSGSGRSGLSVDYLDDPTELHVWGAQMELSTSASPYQKTTLSPTSDDIIPRDESNTSQDVLGNALQYVGETPRPARLIESPCGTFDGVAWVDCGIIDITSWTTFYAEAIFSFTDAGQAIPLSIQHTGSDDIRLFFNGGRIVFTLDDGSQSDLATNNTYNDGEVYRGVFEYDGDVQSSTIYDADGNILEERSRVGATFDFPSATGGTALGRRYTGSFNYEGMLCGVKVGQSSDNLAAYWPISERSGATVFDVSGNGQHGTIKSATTTTGAGFWANTQDTAHYSIINGFTVNGDVQTPALLDGSADATGAPISNPAGAWHNGCTTKIDFTYGIASAETADWETDYEFNDTRTNPLFVRLDNGDGNNDRMLAYRTALSGEDLTKVQTYTEDA